MPSQITLLTLLVRDYDEAIDFYVRILGFELVEDTDRGGGKRWVRVRPPGSDGAALLLARATTPEQINAVGRQTGGRVMMFIEISDLRREHARLSSLGVRFEGPIRTEAYGLVTVMLDLYGNRIDVIEPKQG